MNPAGVFNRVMNAFARAVVGVVNDSTARQTLQIEITKGEFRDNVERAQNYGFTSRPFAGSDAFTSFIGGERAHGVVLVVDDRRYRITGMAEGEVAIYDDLGNVIALKRDRIQITAVDAVQVDAPTVTVNCQTAELVAESATIEADTLDVTATTTFTGPTLINGALTINGSAYVGHTHSNGNDGNPTGGVII